MGKEILIFNHINKTAGSTLRHVIFQVYRGRHVYLMYAYPGAAVERYPEHLALLNEALAPASSRIKAIVSHTGFGLHEALPQHHRYRQFTVLREPVQRTISNYFFVIQEGSVPASTTLEEFLTNTEKAYNVQTADLGGLLKRHHLDGVPLRRDDYDEALLARAKAHLLAHDAFGLTERFDESLVLASEVLGWPSRKLVYLPRNVGTVRRSRSTLTAEQVEMVREHNRLDAALYAFAAEHFERLLNERIPDLPERLQALARMNRINALAAPRLRARLRRHARLAAQRIGLR